MKRFRGGGPHSASPGFGLIEVIAALCIVLATGMLSVSAGAAGWRMLQTARMEADGLSAGRDKVEELVALRRCDRRDGQDVTASGDYRFTRVWRVRPWVGFPGLQRIEVSTRWHDRDWMVLDLVAVAR